MALNDITINRGQGGLGRALDGEDYYSGILFYTDNNPIGTTQAQILSLQQAEDLGIVGDYSDETTASVTFIVDNDGSTGDTVKLISPEPSGNVTICNVSFPSSVNGDGSLQASYIADAINSGTRNHGYNAIATTSTVEIFYRKGLGIYPNTNPIFCQQTGDIDFLFVSTNNGIASEKAVWHYHISEYFRLQPSGNLRVYFAPLSGNAYDYAELGVMQGSATGKLRQVGVYVANTGAQIVSDVASVIGGVQAQCNTLESLHQPMSTVVALDMYGLADLTTLVDLGAYDCRSVSVTIGQDGANLGYVLTEASGFSMTNLGAVLGAVSLSAVNEDIAWVSKFNMTNGTELSVPAFGNTEVVDMVGQANLLNQLNNYRYLFLRTFVGIAGVFVNDNHCAITESSDYAYINDNRVIDKAHRLLYAGVLPFLNGVIILNSDGTMTINTTGYVQGLASTSLDAMIRANEISSYEILIDPAQNILATSTLLITANILPTGVARHITINLGFVTSI